MATNLHKDSAQIYQFPVGGRAGLRARGGDARTTATSVVQMYADYPIRIASGSGWYHEEALLDDDQSHKN